MMIVAYTDRRARSRRRKKEFMGSGKMEKRRHWRAEKAIVEMGFAAFENLGDFFFEAKLKKKLHYSRRTKL